MTDEERKAIEQRVNFIDANRLTTNKTGYDCLAEYITTHHNKSNILHYLELWHRMGYEDLNRSQRAIEQILCYSENNARGTYISPQKQKWLKEWLKGLSTINSTPTKDKSTFRDRILIPNKDSVLAALHPIIDGKGGVTLALIMRALQDEGTISKPSFSEISEEFNIKNTKQAYNNNINNRFNPQELEPIKQAIRTAILSEKQ